MEVGAGRAASVAHLADRLAGAHAVALRDRDRAAPQVHEDVVVVLVVAVEDDVVARSLGLVLHRLDEPAARRHHGGALRRGESLTLGGVAVALCSAAGALAAAVARAG